MDQEDANLEEQKKKDREEELKQRESASEVHLRLPKRISDDARKRATAVVREKHKKAKGPGDDSGKPSTEDGQDVEMNSEENPTRTQAGQ